MRHTPRYGGSVARPLRIEYPGAWYHVMHRGLARRLTFRGAADYADFLALLADIGARWKLEVHAYSLMPNHYHLLVRTPAPNLSRCMRHLNGLYTQRFNRRHRRDGPLFRGRFKSILVEEERYLLELVRYIHLNPVRAGLVDRPEHHRWTSHVHYCRAGKRKAMPHLQTSYMLDAVASRRKSAAKALHEFVMAGVPPELEQRLSGPSLPVILGDEPFKDWVRDNFLAEKPCTPAVPQVAEAKRPYGLPQLLQAVCDVTGCTRQALKRPSRGAGNEGRAMAMYLLWHCLGMKQRHIARAMGSITAAGVAKAIQRLQERLREDVTLRQKVVVARNRSMSLVKP